MDDKKGKLLDEGVNDETKDIKVMKVMTHDSTDDGKLSFDSLVNLVKENEITESLKMIAEKEMYKCVDSSGSSLAHYAAACGNTEYLKFAIANNWKIDDVNQDLKTPLILARENFEEEVIDILFNSDLNMNSSKVSKKSFFDMFIVKKDTEKEIYAFLDKLKIKYSDDEILAGRLVQLDCPLAYAIKWQNKNIVRKMLDLKCSVDATTWNSKLTALHMAAIQADLDIIRLLDDYKANIAAESCSERTPLDYYLHCKSRNSIEAPEILKILARDSQLLFKKNSHGLYPINFAMSLGNDAIIRTILNMDINLLQLGVRNESFLFHAVANQNHEIFNIFRDYPKLDDISKKVVNLKNVDGSRPLSFACRTGNVHAVQYFIDHEVDITIKNNHNQTPLELARKTCEFAKKHNKLDKEAQLNDCIKLLEIAMNQNCNSN